MRTLATAVLAATLALAVASSASAASPVQRLVYNKAVAYWTTQAKAHKTPVRCQAWSAQALTAKYECVFGGGQYRMVIHYGGKCQVQVDAYKAWVGTTDPTARVGDPVLLPLCHKGWQSELPTPWTAA